MRDLLDDLKMAALWTGGLVIFALLFAVACEVAYR